MAVEMNSEDVIRAAEQILNKSASRGFAWAPGGLDLRYGIGKGVIIPLLTNLSPRSVPPPIVENASDAGREDFQAVLKRSLRRTK